MLKSQDLLESNEIDLERLAKDIFVEHNYLRTHPQSYIEKLERVSNFFRGKFFRHPMEIPIETYEGEQAIKLAIDFLKNQKPVNELKYSEELSKAARDHAIDLGENGLNNHIGSNNSTLNDRIEKYIEWDGSIAESIQYCYKFPDNIIMSLLINDGSIDKHERENLFSNEFKYVGIACEKHKRYQLCTVFNYAKSLFQKGIEPPLKNINKITDCEYKPENAVGLETTNIIKSFNGKDHLFNRKIFSLDNGKKYILDYQDYS